LRVEWRAGAVAVGNGECRFAGGWDETVRLWPAYPWKASDYPGDASLSPEARVDLYRSNRLAERRNRARVAEEAQARLRARETEQLDRCAGNLRAIHTALMSSRAAHNDALPDWLSQLVPDYLSTATLLCPRDSEHGLSLYYPDPGTSTSYSFEFCGSVWGTGSIRAWKESQRKDYGDDVIPLVRCHHHGKRLNLSYSGRVYISNLRWEDAPVHLEYPPPSDSATSPPAAARESAGPPGP